MSSYKAFISYSHAADGKLAPALQAALQGVTKPWYRLRTMRIFRDKTSLTANAALWAAIVAALSESEFFVLLASPDAAVSPWVNQEVEYWCAHRPMDRLLLILTEGDLVWDREAQTFDERRSSALPVALRGRIREEPLHVDLRWAKSEDSLTMRHTRFRAAVLDVAGTLLNRPRDELDGEDVRQYRRAKQALVSAIVVTSASAIAAAVAAYDAIRQRDAAVVATRQAERARTAEQAQREVAQARQHDAEVAAQEAQLARGAEARQRLQAEHERREAQRQARLSLSGKLAANSVSSVANDAQLGVLLGLEAVAASYSVEAALSPEIEGALHGAIAASRVRRVLRHDGMVVAVAIGPMGATVATADSQGVRIWDTTSGRVLATFPPLADRPLGLAFSPDGQHLAISGTRSVSLWSLAGQKRLRSFTGHAGGVWSVAFSPDGAQLATAGRDGQALVWDPSSGRLLHSMKGHVKDVSRIVASPNGDRWATSGADGTVRVWDAATGRELLTIKGDGTQLRSVAFSPDGRRLVTGGFATSVRVWDAGSGRPVQVLDGHVGNVFDVAFSPDGNSVATAGQDKSVRLWDARTGKERLVLVGHDEGVLALALTPDGQSLVTASEDKTVRIWDLRDDGEVATLSGHRGPIRSLSFGADAAKLASAGADATVRMWDAARGLELLRLEAHPKGANGVAFGPADTRLASVGADGMLKVWDVATGRELRAWSAHGGASVNAVAYSRDGQWLATGGADRTARVWEAATGRQLAVLSGHQGAVLSVAFSHDGRRLATTADESDSNAGGTVRIWDLATYREIRALHADHVQVRRSVFDPTGRQVATIGYTPPYAVVLWGTDDGREIMRLRPGLAHPGVSLAFTPDGRRLVGSDDDGGIVIWDSANGRELFRLRGPRGTADTIAIDSSGKRLAAAGWDGRIRLTALDAQTLIGLANTSLTRALTSVECTQYLGMSDCSGTPTSLMFAGRQQLDMGSPGAARKAFASALRGLGRRDADARADELVAEALIQEAQARASLSDAAGAGQALRQAKSFNVRLAFEPEAEAARMTVLGRLAYGRQLIKQRRAKEAIDALQQAAILAPGDLDVTLALAEAQEAAGNRAGAIETYRSIPVERRNTAAWVGLGNSYRRQAQFESAVDVLRRAIELDPGNEWPHRVLALTWRDANRIDEAVAELEAAVAVKPTSTAWLELARIHRARGQYARAAASAEEAQHVDPKSADSYRLAGLIYHDDLVDAEKAYQNYRKVLDLESDDPQDKADLAEACLTSGRYEDARVLAIELATSPAMSASLSHDARLTMRFIVTAATLLQGKTADAKTAVDEFVAYYRGLPDGFERTWSYRGTRKFLERKQGMSRRTQEQVMAMLDALENRTALERVKVADALNP